MEYQDYYAALGVKRDASADEIKRAYRKLARKYHPDVSKEKDAEARMQAINEAWTVLSDPEKRAAYDRLGSGFHAGQDFRPPPGWDAGSGFASDGSRPFGAGGDFSDFFSSVFGDMGRAAGGARRSGPGRARQGGGDHHAKVMIDLEDALHGGQRVITLQTPVTDEYGRTVMRERSLNVRIPPGVKAGQQIRLAGQAAASPMGGGAGDLYLEIQFNPHPRYRVEGRDIYATIPVAPWEMALGAQIGVDTPAGRVEVKVPPGSSNGRKLRLKGRGIPGEPAGDLYLVLEVVLPPADTPRARELYEAMARDLAFDPRR